MLPVTVPRWAFLGNSSTDLACTRIDAVGVVISCKQTLVGHFIMRLLRDQKQ